MEVITGQYGETVFQKLLNGNGREDSLKASSSNNISKENPGYTCSESNKYSLHINQMNHIEDRILEDHSHSENQICKENSTQSRENFEFTFGRENSEEISMKSNENLMHNSGTDSKTGKDTKKFCSQVYQYFLKFLFLKYLKIFCHILIL